MWSFLANIATSFLGWYAGSPLARDVVKTVVTDLKEEGQRILPIAVDAIKGVAADQNLSSKGKFDFVCNKIALEVPAVQTSLTNSLVELAYRTLRQDPNVPEVE